MSNDPHASAPILQAGSSFEESKTAVVLLHGRGGSADDILQLASAFGLRNAVFLAPQAAGHTWYPYSFLAPRQQNEPYLSSALNRVGQVIQAIEDKGLSPERIVIAGFSQGACLATEFVASHPARYGGLIAFTGGLIGPEGSIPDSLASSQVLKDMPALLSSGDPDPHVPWSRVKESAAVLRSMGALVELKRHPGRPHTVTAPELDAARTLLSQAGLQ